MPTPPSWLPFEPINQADYEDLQAEVIKRVRSDFFEALQRYDQGELVEAGPAGCDSDKCLLPLAKPKTEQRIELTQLQTASDLFRRQSPEVVGVVYGSGLENQRVFVRAPWVRIPPSPFTKDQFESFKALLTGLTTLASSSGGLRGQVSSLKRQGVNSVGMLDPFWTRTGEWSTG